MVHAADAGFAAVFLLELVVNAYAHGLTAFLRNGWR